MGPVNYEIFVGNCGVITDGSLRIKANGKVRLISYDERMETSLNSNLKNHVTANETADDPTYTKLVESPFYQTYKKAFRDATGLNLALIPHDHEVPVAKQELRYLNPFCQQLNRAGTCQKCAMADRCLMSDNHSHGETITCFAKMKETAIPVRCGKQTIAYLITGQVFTENHQDKDFAEIAELLKGNAYQVKDLASLKRAWTASRTIPSEQYQGIVTLLAAFAVQLSDLLNRLIIEDANSEPDIVSQAKKYVMAHLEDKICLEEVSKRVGVSSFYFCKVFKGATGMTLTEYVNRRRVEWAKRRLANPQARVTEVAFDVGYQSLSQFNRSFLKYVGTSPTRFREEQTSRNLMSRKFAA